MKLINGLPKYTYYYGFSKEQIIELAEMPHKQALLSKKKASNELAKRLLSAPFEDQDSSRINKAIQARKDTEELLAELEY